MRDYSWMTRDELSIQQMLVELADAIDERVEFYGKTMQHDDELDRYIADATDKVIHELRKSRGDFDRQ